MIYFVCGVLVLLLLACVFAAVIAAGRANRQEDYKRLNSFINSRKEK